jgi:NAD(P)-dependent dehydrogenase (short-subunit alcohol dehydrogenase family)
LFIFTTSGKSPATPVAVVKENMTKTCLITGVSGGLGSVIARKFAAGGYRLGLHYNANQFEAENLFHELGGVTNGHQLVKADLRIEREVSSMCESLRIGIGPVGILVNNAGKPFSGMSWKQDLSDWQDVISVNTTGAWLVSKYLIPQMRSIGQGRIIYISSVVAHRPLPGTSAYATAKAALEGLTRAQATELARFNITVNCIAPGYFDAGMIDAVDEPVRSEIIQATPANRLGNPSELAAAVLYLSGEEAAFITGQILHINGGLYI